MASLAIVFIPLALIETFFTSCTYNGRTSGSSGGFGGDGGGGDGGR